MRRRQLLRSMLSIPGLAAIPATAQQTTDKSKPSKAEKLPPEMKPGPVEELPKLATLAPDAAAAPATQFFSPQQFATLRRLTDLVAPRLAARPGGADAAVPEFLDFLIEQSPAGQQALYKTGLDRLEADAQREYRSSFAQLSDADAGKLLAPLREPWTFRGPSEALARFLAVAKEDILRATVNSRQWAAASHRRRSAGLDTYWLSME